MNGLFSFHLKDFLKRHLFIFFIIFLSLIFMSPILNGQFFTSHDSETHAARGAFYERAILAGQFPPRWASEANYGYGSPFFIFYYPLSGYAVALLHIIGISFEQAVIVVSLISYLFGSIFFYFWVRQLFSERVSFFATIFYISLPYHFLTLFVRGGIGEFMAISLLPVIFLTIELLSKRITVMLIALCACSYALLMLSHNGISLMFTPILLIYAFLRSRQTIFAVFVSFFIGLLISAYFWLPSLYEVRYTNMLFYFREYYKDHFAPILSMIYSPWGFGPDIYKKGGLSPQVGVPAFLILISSFWLLIKMRTKLKTRITVFWFGVFVLGVFLSTSFSQILWERIDFLKRFEFPWRFNALSTFSAAAMSGYVFEKLNKKIVIGILIFAFLYSIQFVKVENYLTRGDEYYYKYPGSTYFHAEATTIWSQGDPSNYAKEQFELIGGNAVLKHQTKLSTLHSFSYESTNSATIIDNTVYFPGWKAYIDGVEIPIQFQDPNHKGVIQVSLSEGKHNVEVKFTETKIRLIADFLSIIGIVVVFLIFIGYTPVKNFYLYRRFW